MISLRLLGKLRHLPALYELGVAVRDRKSYFDGLMSGTFSQHGEDTFLSSYFADKPSGRYVEIGASHPFRLSNTYLLYRRGWSGVCVEPIPRLGRLHRHWRHRDILLPVGVGMRRGHLTFFEMTPSVLSTFDKPTADQYVAQGKAVLHEIYEVAVLPINDVFEEAFSLGHVDFISIDVEGMDAELISTLDLERFRPSLICVEVNDNKAQESIESVLQKSRYKVLGKLGCNLFARAEI